MKYNFVIENIAVKPIKFKGFTVPSGGAVLYVRAITFLQVAGRVTDLWLYIIKTATKNLYIIGMIMTI